MKMSNKNALRSKFVRALYDFISEKGEDVGMITSGSFNLPVVTPDGEEGWVEIIVKVPNDESDDGYGKREEYQMTVAKRKVREEELAAKKAAKIKADAAARAAKKAEKEKTANK